MALHHCVQLSLTPGIGPILTRRLIDAAGGAEAACVASTALLRTIDGVGRAKAESLHRALQAAAVETAAEMDRAASLGITIYCLDDEAYPPLLRSIPDPPVVLYAKGTLEPRDLNAVAVVGSRKCSHYGREQAERFSALLAGAGVTVLSGGARGVDSAAHHGAMSHPHGRTIAVLGCGIDVTYPPENTALFQRIAERGAVLSEYPLRTPPLADNFPRRNRIVSGMSRGVLVIEADERSGALITARQASEDHNRSVFAMPGRVDNPLSIGPHQLIRDGAYFAARLDDILENLGPLPSDLVDEPGLFAKVAAGPKPHGDIPDAPFDGKGLQIPAADLSGVTERQRTILSLMGNDAIAVDGLIGRSDLPAQVVLQELTFLTLKGQVKRIDGQTYRRR